MSLWKKIVLGVVGVMLVFAVLFVIFVGPWPVYEDSEWESSDYYAQAIADIAAHAADSERTNAPGTLKAGWGFRDITPRIGVPLAGYGGRKGDKASTGVRDELEVKALAFSDGKDTAVLVGSDMLIIPPNVSAMVRARVAEQVPLTADDILFNASHTHCGLGGWAPGIAGNVTGGAYDETVPEFLAERFTEAIVEAYNSLEPAKLASGSVDAAKYIRNRARDAGVDPELSWLYVEQEDGDNCYLVSFSAHPTIFSDDMMEFSAEYPGELRRRIERETRADTVYLGGAVGSMSPRAPEGATPSERVAKMGIELADLVLAHAKPIAYETEVDVASIGVPLGMPPMQMRPVNASFRMSPLISGVLGLPKEGWMHGVRVGSLVFVGMPCDFSGEISVDWKAWAENQGYDLWTLSFCAAYCGYFSPDRYYKEEPLGYETGMMSWFGPNVEAYFTALFHKFVEELAPPARDAA